VVLVVQVHDFMLVRILLLLQFVVIVLLQFCSKFFTLLILHIDLSKINFELAQKAVYGALILSFNLLDLFLVSLLHFQTFLLELKIAIALLLEFLLK